MKHHLMLTACLLAGALVKADTAQVAGNELTKVIPGTITRKAENGTLYSRNELEFLTVGILTPERIAKISKASRKENSDPVSAIVDFNQQLKDLNIKLIVIPVPPKAAALPLPGQKPGEASEMLKPLYDHLRAKGIEVLDLTPDFVAEKDVAYCRSDSHWSPSGMKIAAIRVAEITPFRGKTDFPGELKNLTVSGDLAQSAKLDFKETVPARVVSGNVFTETAPVLLLSDSHGLVFSTGGDMLAENAGFGEQLAMELHSPIDRIAVRGSASTPVRVNLYRKATKDPAWLKEKKIIVWVFSCRELTESVNGWAKVPVTKK